MCNASLALDAVSSNYLRRHGAGASRWARIHTGAGSNDLGLTVPDLAPNP